MLPYYKKYAEHFNVDVSEGDLFEMCNRTHQNKLKENFLVHIKRPEEIGCDTSVYGACRGWWLGDYRCECGNTKRYCWEDDNFDPSNLDNFTIFSREPFGHVTW